MRASTLFSEVEKGAVGNGGNVEVTTGSLFVTNGARLETGTEGEGNAGNVIVNARDTVSFDGISRDGRLFSSILSNVVKNATGRGGNVEITTGTLSLTNGALLNSSTEGKGDGGNIIIEARDRVSLDGFAIPLSRQPEDFVIRIFPSVIYNGVGEGGDGNSGDIRITTRELSITNGAKINASTAGQGSAGSIIIKAVDRVSLGNTQNNSNNLIQGSTSEIRSAIEQTGNGKGGDIRITTGSLSLSDNASLNTSTNGQGKAGSVLIDASNQISLDRDAYIASVVDRKGNGNGGDIRITTGSLFLAGAAQLDSSTFGQGSAGDVIIEARDTVSFSGTSSDGRRPSSILSTVEETANGNGGNVRIKTGSLLLTDGGTVSTGTRGRGNAGNVIIEARDRVSLNNNADIASGVGETGNGTGGDIRIDTRSLSMTNGAELIASTSGQGKAGNIIVESRNQVSLDSDAAISSTVNPTGNGNSGDIRIFTGSLSVTNGALLQTSTFGLGNAGNVIIEARDSVAFTGTIGNNRPASVYTTVGKTGKGDAGNINISTGALLVSEKAQLSASTFGQGDAGDIIINVRNDISLDNALIYSIVGDPFAETGNGDGDAGDIRITTGSLFLTHGAQLANSTFGRGNAGNIFIEARDNVSFSGVNSDRLATAAYSIVGLTGNGNGGNIRISTKSLSVTDGARLSNTTSGQGNAGNIRIDASNSVLLDGVNSRTGFISQLSSSTFEEANGRGGTITVNTDSFRIANGARVNAQTFGTFRGGNVIINTQNLNLNDRAQISTSSLGTGNAGNITIAANQTLNANNSDITTNAAKSSGGEIRITARDIRLFGDNDIRTDVASGENQGGNITITADSIIAFDDSDILAFARDGRGGNITFNTSAFFGSGYQAAVQGTNLDSLDGNNRVDVNASGAISSGNISTPDTNSVQNNLSELLQNPIDTNVLLANSCIARSDSKLESSFTITGSGGLRQHPGNAFISYYPTGDVRNVQDHTASRPWQKGDPIVEPLGVYQLPNGKLVLSRECS